MSRVLSHGDGTSPLRLVVPDSPELLTFLNKVYARENSNVAGGSKATLTDYRIQVGTLQKFFDRECQASSEPGRPLRIADVTDPLVAGCMAWMIERGLASRTCNKLRRTIRAIQAFAIEEKEHFGKVLRVKKLKESKTKPRAWRPEQIGSILSAARQMPPTKRGTWDGRDDYALILFLLNTGTRITATMLTPKSGLDLQSGEITVPAAVQKHDSDEIFDLVPATIEALKGMHPSPDGRLFGHWPYDDSVNGKWRSLTNRLREILVRSGLFASVEEIPKRVNGFHKFRKCFATFMRLKHGKEKSTEACGHSGGTVTQAYWDETQIGDRPSCREALAGILVLPAAFDRQQKLFD